MAFLVAGSLHARTGGSIYNRRLIETLRERGWHVDVRELDASFPFPTPSALDHAAAVMGDLEHGAMAVVDGLAFGAMPDIVRAARGRLRLVAIVHLPLAATIGIDAPTSRRLAESERGALEEASLVIVPGAAGRELLATCGLPASRARVVEPGTDRAPLAAGSGGLAPEIVTAAAVTPGKGHDVLLDALEQIRDRQWHLTCAGSLTRDAATAERVRAGIAARGLASRVSLVGELSGEALNACFHRADLFVSASLRETYGMAVAEALARGLPVVATDTGAAPALVRAEAGSIVPAGDAAALIRAIAAMLDDPAVRARCAEGARRVRERLPDWSCAAARFEAALRDAGLMG
jgi:glycosyltransferase involved in cell wall biosynthesis